MSPKTIFSIIYLVFLLAWTIFTVIAVNQALKTAYLSRFIKLFTYAFLTVSVTLILISLWIFLQITGLIS
ncbi:hypothetical protein AUJ78_00590 [Candidatus Peregrinibacteria bacterium CG1_02_41_10]|nr:MAG: hypothetical protein AUJ78_00590 [Candidatus Peregrinibacteria bacterium CG1_02_41_10]